MLQNTGLIGFGSGGIKVPPVIHASADFQTGVNENGPITYSSVDLGAATGGPKLIIVGVNVGSVVSVVGPVTIDGNTMTKEEEVIVTAIAIGLFSYELAGSVTSADLVVDLTTTTDGTCAMLYALTGASSTLNDSSSANSYTTTLNVGANNLVLAFCTQWSASHPAVNWNEPSTEDFEADSGLSIGGSAAHEAYAVADATKTISYDNVKSHQKIACCSVAPV